MQNRADIVEENFLKKLSQGTLPDLETTLTPRSVGLEDWELVDLFESQLMSRLLDIEARNLRAKNQCYYTIGSSGHEGNAVFGKVFRHTDMAFLHYRSCPFMIQRSKQLAGESILYDLLLSFVAAKEDPISGGRHKVLGSKKLFIPPQTSTISSHLPKAIGAALSVTRTKSIGIESSMPEDSVVLCSFGDASFNHSTAIGAINSSEWIAYQNIPLPLIYICEDNGLGISVHTPENWVENNIKGHPVIRYFKCDGRNLLDVYQCTKRANEYSRVTKRPSFLHMKTVRLLGHAGSDIESSYHSVREIENAENQDPILYSAALLLKYEIMTSEEISKMYIQLKERISRIGSIVAELPKQTYSTEIMKPIFAKNVRNFCAEKLDQAQKEKLFAHEYRQQKHKQTMGKLINWSLTELLYRYPQAVLFGEDVAKKGGVYHITAGLLKKFGQKRVFNSLLDETTILGTAIGMAHNEILPVPEIQFLAYAHNAHDQIRGEAATLSFFSEGQYTNGMVIRIASLAYQKGFGGHFHNDNSIAMFMDIPGIVLACPSNGEDAVKMLRTCFREAYNQGKVILFLEPIALYNARDLIEPSDGGWTRHYPNEDEEISLGEFATYGDGKDLCLISYANGFYLSMQAKDQLEKEYGLKITLIDLRWFAPIKGKKLCDFLKAFPRILMVDECRKSGSPSERIFSLMLDEIKLMPKVKRHCAEDSFIPLGAAANEVLPSKESIVKAALEIMEDC